MKAPREVPSSEILYKLFVSNKENNYIQASSTSRILSAQFPFHASLNTHKTQSYVYSVGMQDKSSRLIKRRNVENLSHWND